MFVLRDRTAKRKVNAIALTLGGGDSVVGHVGIEGRPAVGVADGDVAADHVVPRCAWRGNEPGETETETETEKEKVWIFLDRHRIANKHQSASCNYVRQVEHTTPSGSWNCGGGASWEIT